MFQVLGETVETNWAPPTTVPPPVHVTVTLTEAGFGTSDQILLTVKVVSFRVLVIVQLPGLSRPPVQVPAGLPLAE
jgi:hypothetical protein